MVFMAASGAGELRRAAVLLIGDALIGAVNIAFGLSGSAVASKAICANRDTSSERVWGRRREGSRGDAEHAEESWEVIWKEREIFRLSPPCPPRLRVTHIPGDAARGDAGKAEEGWPSLELKSGWAALGRTVFRTQR
jgi:hypothetical protein